MTPLIWFLLGVLAEAVATLVGVKLYSRFSPSFRRLRKFNEDAEAHVLKSQAEGVCYGCGISLTKTGDPL